MTTQPDGKTPDQSNALATVAWAGDINLGRRFHYRSVRAQVRDQLARIAPFVAADLRIVNLECVVATSGKEGIDKLMLGTTRNEYSPYYFRARPEMLEILLRGGVDVVTTANNHSGDYGPDALVEQGHWLDLAGIDHIGSGRHLEEAFSPLIRRVGGLNIALFGLDATQPDFVAGETRPGHAWLDPTKPQGWCEIMKPRIEAAREQADIVVLVMHWGMNGLQQPDKMEIIGGHALIDAGADAILGASSHLLQGVEIYKNKPIVHDAGNFLFDAVSRKLGDGGIFILEMDGSGVKHVIFTPLEIGFCQTVVPALPQAISITTRFEKKCAELGTRLEITKEGQGVIEMPDDRPVRNLRPPIPVAPKVGAKLAPLSEPRPEWLAEVVPEDARLAEPLRLGPLELLGVRAYPQQIDRLRSIHVESWWRLAEPTTVDWRIDFLASPDKPGPVGDWGGGSEHDPCDWMWPTSRWRTGQIYRDFYSLRRPAVREWVDQSITLSVGLVSQAGRIERHCLPGSIEFKLLPKVGLEVSRANPAQYQIPPVEKISPTPQILWTAQQLEEITGGTWLVKPPQTWFVRSVTHRAEQLESGCFAAPALLAAVDQRMAMRHELPPNVWPEKYWDTHDQLPAKQKLIAGAIVAHSVDGLAPDFPLLQVTDPLHAVMQLGVAARNRLKGQVVAVAGSVGKTALCQMLIKTMAVDHSVLGDLIAGYHSRAGILHTMANAPEFTDLVVVETEEAALNARQFQNSRLLRPNIGIIVNVMPPRSSNPKPRLDVVARRMANIVESLEAGGALLLHREIEFFDFICKRAQEKSLRLITYGQSEDANLRLLDYDQHSGRICARLPDGKEVEYGLNVRDKHMALNSLACIGVRLALGWEIEPWLKECGTFMPPTEERVELSSAGAQG
ncbi:MAG: CapA family protein [Burkholderiaceae bacterium]|jgi:hypothetical protein|nr:CapA family protein [Burkholderiaceae bacterium]